jgi:Copper transport outer membrane protein, MctB
VVLDNRTFLVIDFRYHLVSIIAVFLALAVGLVVGATALAPATADLLKTAESVLSKTNANLTKVNQNYKNQVNADQAFAQEAAPRLLQGLMTGQKVVVVTAPGYDSAVASGVTKALQQAGATVTGQVNVSPSFLLTGGHDEDLLTQLAQSLATTADVTLPAQTSSSVAGQQAAGKVLAASLLTASGTGLPPADSTDILKDFSQGGYVTLGNAAKPVSAPATLAVLVAPGAGAPQGGQVLVALAAALKSAGSGTVMVGGADAVGSNSAIDTEITAGQVSTVDNADTETGQIMTVQALKLALDGKPVGEYGPGPNAAPSPAPTPTPSSSGTSTATPNVSTSSGGHK